MRSSLVRAELLKLRRSNLIAVMAGFPLFTTALVSLLLLFIAHVAVQVAQAHPAGPHAADRAARAAMLGSWKLLFVLAFQLWTVFMFPIMAMAVATVVSQAEHGSRAWSFSLSLKTSRWRVYAVKGLIIAAATALSCLLLVAMLLAAGGIRALAGNPLSGPMDCAKVFSQMGQVFLGGLWMIALQAWTGLRYRSMIPLVMVSAGLIVIEITAMIAAPLIGPEKTWMMFVPSVTPMAAMSSVPAWHDAMWVGLGGGAVCFLLMLVHLSRRETP